MRDDEARSGSKAESKRASPPPRAAFTGTRRIEAEPLASLSATVWPHEAQGSCSEAEENFLARGLLDVVLSKATLSPIFNRPGCMDHANFISGVGLNMKF